ncbi:MAG TPA: protease pro-enzyme activation domain-containing protein [Thermoplasmata archaeon]|nr:protease pro-enzyme activation domain-containing protein [Thermoplasmata archaeon]
MFRARVALAVTLTVVLVWSAAQISLAPGPTDGPVRHTLGSPAVATVFATDATPIPTGVPTQPMPSSDRVYVTLSLAEPGAAQLSQFLQSVEEPSSTQYRHFLTDTEFVARYAPSEAEEAAVTSTLRSAGGVALTIFPDRSAVSVSLSVAEVRTLFGVTLVQFGQDGRSLSTATGTPVLAPALRGLVSGISGLSNAGPSGFSWNLASSGLHRLVVRSGPNEFVNYTPTGGVAGTELFFGSDFTQEFGASELFPGSNSVPDATFPTKVAIATLLASGYNGTLHENLPPYDPNVTEAYLNSTLPRSWPLPNVSGVPVTAEGVTPPAPGSFGSLNDSLGDEFENSLDLEMAGSLAPGASVVNFYFGGNLIANATSSSSIANDFALTLSTALAHNYSPARLAVVSGSFGLPDLNDSEWNFETSEAAATGVTIVIASGDSGDAPNNLNGRDSGQWPTWPATADSNDSGAIAVGGVSLAVGGRATADWNGSAPLNLTFDSNLTGITSDTAWYDTLGGIAGTEGGVSAVVPEPEWQRHSAAQPEIVNATEKQGASSLGRAEPDVAMPANDTIATVWANSTEAIYFDVLQGTSVAAPVLAGLLADVVAVESNRSAGGWAPLGFFDPEIYNISSYFAANPSSADPFSAVTTGTNYVFSATSGWDALTGWGTVNAALLLAADENPAIAGYQYTGPTPGLPPPPPTPAIPWATIYLIFGAGIIAAVALIYLAARPRRSGTPMVPPGARGAGPPVFGPGTQGGIYPGATFLCPFCGAVRPAEPVRCPQCGAY